MHPRLLLPVILALSAPSAHAEDKKPASSVFCAPDAELDKQADADLAKKYCPSVYDPTKAGQLDFAENTQKTCQRVFESLKKSRKGMCALTNESASVTAQVNASMQKSNGDDAVAKFGSLASNQKIAMSRLQHYAHDYSLLLQLRQNDLQAMLKYISKEMPSLTKTQQQRWVDGAISTSTELGKLYNRLGDSRKVVAASETDFKKSGDSVAAQDTKIGQANLNSAGAGSDITGTAANGKLPYGAAVDKNGNPANPTSVVAQSTGYKEQNDDTVAEATAKKLALRTGIRGVKTAVADAFGSGAAEAAAPATDFTVSQALNIGKGAAIKSVGQATLMNAPFLQNFGSNAAYDTMFSATAGTAVRTVSGAAGIYFGSTVPANGPEGALEGWSKKEDLRDADGNIIDVNTAADVANLNYEDKTK